MSIHIEELICNVTVRLGAHAMPLVETPAVADQAPDEPAPSSPLVLPRTISQPEAEEIMAGTVARQTKALAAEGAIPPAVDVKALADRVYRLMREELELDRERE